MATEIVLSEKPALNHLSIINAGGAGECFYFSIYGACVLHNENYIPLTRNEPNFFANEFLKALGHTDKKVANRDEFNREIRMIVADALQSGILDEEDRLINRYKALTKQHDPSSAKNLAAVSQSSIVGETADESTAEILHELGPAFRTKFYSNIKEIKTGKTMTIAEYDKLRGDIIVLGNRIEQTRGAAEKTNLQEQLRQKSHQFDEATAYIIHTRSYTQASYNADLAAIRRENLTDFANTIDFTVIDKLLKRTNMIRLNTIVGDNRSYNGKIESNLLQIYIYDSVLDRIIPNINILKLRDSAHYNFFCQTDIYAKYSKYLTYSNRESDMNPNRDVPAYDKTLYALKKFLMYYMNDIKGMGIYKKDQDSGSADPGEWRRFCGDKIAVIVRAIGHYRGLGTGPNADDNELMRAYIDSIQGDVTKFQTRCEESVATIPPAEVVAKPAPYQAINRVIADATPIQRKKEIIVAASLLLAALSAKA